MLELKDSTLTVEGRTLFRNLSLMAQDGQLTCITGSAGAGKTALVRALLGFLPLDEGLVSIDGELLTPLSAPVFRRLMAYVPQRLDVAVSQPVADVAGLETVWSPLVGRNYQLTAIDDHLDVAPLASKPIVIVDAPDVAMLTPLKALAAEGHAVVVATQREEFLNVSDKIVTLGDNDNIRT